MNITESLIKKIEHEGVILEDRQDVYESIDKAIIEGRFDFIRIDGKNAGFVTWNRVGEDVFVNNLLIYKEHRGKFNVLSLRKLFKSMYNPIRALTWRSRKKGKDVAFIQQRKKYDMAK